ncbi:MAG: hypothetical protein IT452_04250 [Planctomycetia bacterium]|nr:hypothetical protein [Planctomycetia bacterium]
MIFVKLDCRILQSSLWSTPPAVRLTFITILAMTEPDGLCRATAPGIAHAARLPEEDVRKALQVLEGPDLDSRCTAEDGRRIVRVDGGYRVVNYLRYREYESPGAKRTREWRERHGLSQHVTGVTGVTGVTQKEKKREKKREKEKEKTDNCNVSSSEPATAPASELAPPPFIEGDQASGVERLQAPGAPPPELADLDLYRANPQLLRQWPTLMKAWSAAYPGVDIVAEVRKAHAWEAANPRKRKVDKPRFLGSWLARAQDKPGTSAATKQPATAPPSDWSDSAKGGKREF